MQQPKKTKYRKQQKMVRHLKGVETRGCELEFGDYGLVALESDWITSREIEAARRSVARYVKKTGKVWIRMFPDKPITKKPAETRMGSGKGSPEYWVAEVRKGRVVYEVTGLDDAIAVEALQRAGAKLRIKTKVIRRKATLL